MSIRLPFMLALSAAAPPAAWFAAQQALGSLTYYRCATAGPPIGLAVAVAGLGACLAAAALAWRRTRAVPPHDAPFAARVTLGLAVIFALANMFTVLAIVLIPPCVR